MNSKHRRKKIARRKLQVKRKGKHQEPFWLQVVKTQKTLFGTAPTKEMIEKAFDELVRDGYIKIG